MKKTFFPKLAASNIKKNKKTYIPYILTCILTVAMFYIVYSLSQNPGMEKMSGGETIAYMLTLGCWIIALFAFIFLFYTNSFLIKRRKKEFGIFNILGMEKRHLSIVLGWETVYVLLISLSAGLFLGIVLDKVMFLLIGRVLGARVVFGFFIAPEALRITVLLFAAIFALILLNSLRQIHIAEPMELLRDGSAGEKEPKTKWLMTVLGIICIGSGYYLAITVEDPLQSIFVFFIAVVLVILGTYMLFTAGSIALLKLMRKNKGYYYKTKHFISISGMIYRMKQNAVGLSNICILSTMVLVMVSSTSSMMVGMEDILSTRYPSDMLIYSHEADETRSEELFQFVRQLQEERDIIVNKEFQYTYLDFSAYRDGDTFSVERHAPVSMVGSIHVLLFMLLSDYNAVEGENKVLDDGEILIYSNRGKYDEPVLKLFGKEYKVAEELDHFIGNGSVAASMASAQYIIVPDRKELDEICKKQKEALDDISSDISQFYGFDMEAGEEEQKSLYDALREYMKEQQLDGYIESKAAARSDFAGLYGGFFFIGIFLGFLFVMATVLIIYYKQISEGYDDKERFAIMQKVGMSRSEVKASIHSQVLTVFFLPLIVAGIHVTAAFPLISKLLALMNFVNTKLYIVSTVVSFLVFSVMYCVIYLLTARNYYNIVRRRQGL